MSKLLSTYTCLNLVKLQHLSKKNSSVYLSCHAMNSSTFTGPQMQGFRCVGVKGEGLKETIQQVVNAEYGICIKNSGCNDNLIERFSEAELSAHVQKLVRSQQTQL